MPSPLLPDIKETEMYFVNLYFFNVTLIMAIYVLLHILKKKVFILERKRERECARTYRGVCVVRVQLIRNLVRNWEIY